MYKNVCNFGQKGAFQTKLINASAIQYIKTIIREKDLICYSDFCGSTGDPICGFNRIG